MGRGACVPSALGPYAHIDPRGLTPFRGVPSLRRSNSPLRNTTQLSQNSRQTGK